LNLSTTLEGALAGVRASVVALAGAVDSLGRRSDIALTNETLRLNEEVMSLRANVHGLRMQVCSLHLCLKFHFRTAVVFMRAKCDPRNRRPMYMC
jgi:hypothetical protein